MPRRPLAAPPSLPRTAWRRRPAAIVDRHRFEQFLQQLVGRPTGPVGRRRPVHAQPDEPQPPGVGFIRPEQRNSPQQPDEPQPPGLRFIRAEQPNSPQRAQHARHPPLALRPGLAGVVVAAGGHPLELSVQEADGALTSGCHTQSLAPPNRACDLNRL